VPKDEKDLQREREKMFSLRLAAPQYQVAARVIVYSCNDKKRNYVNNCINVQLNFDFCSSKFNNEISKLNFKKPRYGRYQQIKFFSINF